MIQALLRTFENCQTVQSPCPFYRYKNTSFELISHGLPAVVKKKVVVRRVHGGDNTDHPHAKPHVLAFSNKHIP